MIRYRLKNRWYAAWLRVMRPRIYRECRDWLDKCAEVVEKELESQLADVLTYGTSITHIKVPVK